MMYGQTQIKFNTYCFSSVTLVARTRLSIALCKYVAYFNIACLVLLTLQHRFLTDSTVLPEKLLVA